MASGNGATHAASRVIDFLALKLGLGTFEADAVDAYCEVFEHEEVVVELAPEYLERLAKAGRDTDIVCRLRRQLPGRRAAGQSWVEHVAGILVNKLGFVRCTTAPQFYWSSERMVALELHMDGIHGAATASGREKFVKDLALEINFKGGDRCETGKPTKPEASGICCEPIGTDRCEDETDPWSTVTSCDNGCYTFGDC